MSSDKYLVSRLVKTAVILTASFVLSGCTLGIGMGSGTSPENGQFVKGALADGFPSNLPLYKDAVPVESYGSESEFGASFIADENLLKVVNFYSTALPQLGWQSSLSEGAQDNYVFDISSDLYSGSVVVNVAADGKKTAITMAVSQR